MLATIKNASKEVNEKLVEAAEKTIEINEKRELFRPVAARGAVLYFCIVELTQINWMYNTFSNNSSVSSIMVLISLQKHNL